MSDLLTDTKTILGERTNRLKRLRVISASLGEILHYRTDLDDQWGQSLPVHQVGALRGRSALRTGPQRRQYGGCDLPVHARDRRRVSRRDRADLEELRRTRADARERQRLVGSSRREREQQVLHPVRRLSLPSARVWLRAHADVLDGRRIRLARDALDVAHREPHRDGRGVLGEVRSDRFRFRRAVARRLLQHLRSRHRTGPRQSRACAGRRIPVLQRDVGRDPVRGGARGLPGVAQSEPLVLRYLTPHRPGAHAGCHRHGRAPHRCVHVGPRNSRCRETPRRRERPVARRRPAHDRYRGGRQPHSRHDRERRHAQRGAFHRARQQGRSARPPAVPRRVAAGLQARPERYGVPARGEDPARRRRDQPEVRLEQRRLRARRDAELPTPRNVLLPFRLQR